MSDQHHASAALYPREKYPRYPLAGGWVDPRADLDAEARSINSKITFVTKIEMRVVEGWKAGYQIPAEAMEIILFATPSRLLYRT
jgi:hypothetical protein